MVQRTPHILVLVMLMMVAIAGCDEQKPVRSYTIAKDEKAPPPPSPITWALPTGWTSFNDGNPMRYATIRTSEQAGALEITVSRFPGGAGGVMQNIQRWAGQVDFSAEGQQPERVITSRQCKDGEYLLVDMTGQKKDQASGQPLRILGAVMHDAESSWFIKAMGPADKLEPYKADFVSLTDSIGFAKPAPSTAEAPPTVPQPSPDSSASRPAPPPFIAAPRTDPRTPAPVARDASLPTWQAPEGWQAGPPTQFAAASFLVEKGDSFARVTVSSLPHPPFAEAQESQWLLENINRWRAQARLDPAATLDDTKAHKVTIAGMPAWAVDVVAPDTGPGADPAAARILGVIIVRDADSLFIKMTGPTALVGEQKDTFTQFVQSFKFDRKE